MSVPSLKPVDGLHLNWMVNTIKEFNDTQGWSRKYYEILEVLKGAGREDLIPVVKNYRSGTMIALIHSELSEALEGLRKGLKDDHLTDRPMVEVEMADVFIRTLDFAAEHDLNLGDAVIAKDKYNHDRADHKPENRAKENGKKF